MKGFPLLAKRLPSVVTPTALVTAVAMMLAGSSRAADVIWDGNLSPNWADFNWSGGNNPPQAGDLLLFSVAGSAGAVLNNNLTPLISVAGITFNIGASAFTFNGNAVTLGGSVINNSTSLQTINFDLQLDATRAFTTTTGGGDLQVNGVLSGAGGWSKTGAGTLFVGNAANTFTGETIFGSGGVVNVASLSDYGVASSIGARTFAMENNTPNGIGLHFMGGTLRYTGSTPQTTNREIRILGSPTVGAVNNVIDASGSNPSATLSFTKTGTNINLYDTGGHRTLTLTGTNTGANSFSIRLTDQAANTGLTNLSKDGVGTWYITNTDSTYTGETFFRAGILNVASVSDYGVASSIGSRSLANENTTVTGVGLHFLGGTLQYTGSTPQSTNRNIRVLNGNGAFIDASGSNPSATLSFTHTGANMNLFDTGGVRTITLTGTNTGENGFSILLANQSTSVTNLSKTGTGTWVLNGPDTNSATGLTSVTNGTLVLDKTNALAVNGTLTIGGGTAQAAVRIRGVGGNQIVDTNIPTFLGTGATAGILQLNDHTETVAGLSSTGGAGIVENESAAGGTGTLVLNVAATPTFAGILRDGDGIGTDGKLAVTKMGNGTMILSGISTHTGATTVNAGTLTISGSLTGTTVTINGGALNGTGTVNGPVNVASNGLLSGALTITGLVNVNGGTLTSTGILAGGVIANTGAHLVPGSALLQGTLTASSLGLLGGANVDFELGGANDLVVVTDAGGLNLVNGTINLFASGSTSALTANGTYTLFDYNTNFNGLLSNLKVGNAQVGKFYSLTNDATNTLIQITVADATSSEWSGAGGNNLWTNAGNWSAGVPNGAGAVANFGQIPGTATTVALNGSKTVGGILFNNLNGYTITGGAGETITFDNGVAATGISVLSGQHVISAPIQLVSSALTSTANGTSLVLSGGISGASSLTAAGSGTTILTGNNTYGATDVTGGTLRVGNGATSGTLGTGPVNLAAGTQLVFDRSDNVTVNNTIGGASAQVTQQGSGRLVLNATNTFGTSGTGRLNLANGTVQVGVAGALANGVALNFTGGTLDLNSFPLTVSALSGGTGVLTDLSTSNGITALTVDQVVDATTGAAINDGLGRQLAVRKLGTGALTLTGANTFSGGLTILNGNVLASNPTGQSINSSVTLGDGFAAVSLITGVSNQFGPNTVLNFTNGGQNAKFSLRGTNQTVAGLDSTADPNFSLAIIQNDEATLPGYTVAPGPATLTINAVGNHNFAGLIRNNVGGALNIVKEGSGTQVLRNVLVQAANFGNATINAGKLTFNLATNASGTNTLGAGTNVIVNAGGTLGLDGNWTMNRPISGDGEVRKDGTGSVTINALNTYTGRTTVSEGTLVASTVGGTAIPGHVTMGTGLQSGIFLITTQPNQFGPNTVFTFDNGPARDAKFELRGQPQTIGGLQSDADDTLSIVQNQESGAPGSTTLTINTTGDYVFHGLIRTQAGGALNLLKTGMGTQEIRNIAAAPQNFGLLTIDQGKFVINLSGVNNTLGAATTVTVNTAGTLGLDGNWEMNRVISGDGGVVKQGTGTVTVSSSNLYTGPTVISGGTLNLNGALELASLVTVQLGGRLSGVGTMGIVISESGSSITPGAPTTAGTLTMAGLTLDAGSALTFDLSFPSFIGMGVNDLVFVTGNLTLDGTLSVNEQFGFGEGTYRLFDFGGILTDHGLQLDANFLAAHPGSYVDASVPNQVNLVVVPEPGVAALVLGGLGWLAARRRSSRGANHR